MTRPKQGKTTFEVWSVGDQGVLHHATKSMLRRGALHPEQQPMQIWRRPKSRTAGTPHRWQWRGPLLAADVGSGNKAGETGPGQ